MALCCSCRGSLANEFYFISNKYSAQFHWLKLRKLSFLCSQGGEELPPISATLNRSRDEVLLVILSSVIRVGGRRLGIRRKLSLRAIRLMLRAWWAPTNDAIGAYRNCSSLDACNLVRAACSINRAARSDSFRRIPRLRPQIRIIPLRITRKTAS